MKNTFLLLASTLVLLSSCKKEIDTLPEATQSGANIFGAKINGENWGPLGGSFLTLPTLEARFGADSSIFINARNFSRSPTETEMEIHLWRVTGVGTYSLNQLTAVYPSQTASYAYYVKRKLSVEDEWMTTTDATGQVQLTKVDWTSRIVSGTFSFTANAKYGSAALVVTEGRFDVKAQ
jgi:hypothetical protein